MRVDFSTYVVSPGVRVVVSIRKGSPLSEAARDYVTSKGLTVQDVVDIRSLSSSAPVSRSGVSYVAAFPLLTRRPGAPACLR